MDIRLDGMAALITGGSEGVGKGMAIKFAGSGAEGALGKIDIVVNNAGTSQAGPFLTITDEEWHDDFELKLFAAVRLCRLGISAMQSRKWGRIINVLNIGGKAPGAYGETEEFANIACFLASDEGGYITGTAINVDGGRSPVV